MVKLGNHIDLLFLRIGFKKGQKFRVIIDSHGKDHWDAGSEPYQVQVGNGTELFQVPFDYLIAV